MRNKPLIVHTSYPYNPSHSSSSSSSLFCALRFSTCFLRSISLSRSFFPKSTRSRGQVPRNLNQGLTHSKSKRWVEWQGNRTTKGYGSSRNGLLQIGQDCEERKDFFGTLSRALFPFYSQLVSCLSKKGGGGGKLKLKLKVKLNNMSIPSQNSSLTPSSSRGGESAWLIKFSIIWSINESCPSSSPPVDSCILRITSNASASERNAALTSAGTGTAWGRVRVSVGLGVISERVAKKDDKSGRRGRAVFCFWELASFSVLCSTVSTFHISLTIHWTGIFSCRMKGIRWFASLFLERLFFFLLLVYSGRIG